MDSIDQKDGGGNTLADRLKIVEDLDLDTHGDTARLAGRSLTIVSEAASAARCRLRDARALADEAEASLVMSEGFRNNLNEQVRRAWLTLQWVEDPVLVGHRRDVEAAEAKVTRETLREFEQTRAFRLALSEMELAAARLRFLAGGA